MPQGSSNGGRAKPEARPSQHISSIAHLFFDNQSEDGPLETAQSVCHILVVGTGRDTGAPYTAAGLGHHFLDQSRKLEERGALPSGVPIRQVFFGEPSPVCFSGLSHLDPQTFRPPTDEEPIPWKMGPFANSSVIRLFPREVPSEDFSGGLSDGRFFIRHFDLPRDAELHALETQLLGGNAIGLDNDGADGVVWCVNANSCTNLALVARLGRLLRIVSPSKLFVLVFFGRQKGTSRDASSFSSDQRDALLEQARILIEYIADKVSVDLNAMGVSSDEKAVSLSVLARKLSPF